ncbi:GumC family protein [Mesopusillimonas faecipullorum]|nr:GumC family protein [Mesopusillimonas faecipullorum]
MLSARRHFILFFTGAILGLTALITLLSPKVWTASADIYIDYRENDQLSGRTISPFLDDSYMQTQMDLMHSQRVVDLVIDSLQLRTGREYLSLQAKHGQQRADQELIKSISQNIDIQRAHGSRVVSISYLGNSPQQAQQFADALANAYIELGEKVAMSMGQQRFEQYSAQLENLQNEIDRIQNTLTNYQQSTGMLNVQEHGDLESQKLKELTSTLLQVQNRIEDVRARNRSTQQLLDSGIQAQDIPQITQLPSLLKLKEHLANIDRQLGSVQGSMGPNHPTVRGLQTERRRLLNDMQREVTASLDAENNELISLQQQAESLEQEIEQQRKKMLTQMDQRDRISTYQRQLASAQLVYRAALEKYDSLAMAGNISVTNATLLQAAELPTSPSSPRPMLNLLLGLFIGVLVACCLALTLELLNRRVRCIEDLRGYRNQLPLLGQAI